MSTLDHITSAALYFARQRRAQRAATFDALMVPVVSGYDHDLDLVEGTASPSATVRLLVVATGTLLGMTVAEPDGSWAILAEGLTPGTMLVAYSHDSVGHVKHSAVFEVGEP